MNGEVFLKVLTAIKLMNVSNYAIITFDNRDTDFSHSGNVQFYFQQNLNILFERDKAIL